MNATNPFLFSDTFDVLFGNTAYGTYSWLPVDGGGYELSLAVPGFSKEDLKISITGKTLSVEGNIDSNLPSHIVKKRINRKFTLRDELVHDLEKITASVKNGVLTVFIPQKNPNNASGGTIEIPIS